MIQQQIAISGLGGQGVLFITQILAQAALEMEYDVISSETHGMAMRGGAVISHLKIGPFASPLIRNGQADLALFFTEENLTVHPGLLGPKTKVIVNTPKPECYENLDAARLAEEKIGRRQAANLVLLGYTLGRGYLFCHGESIEAALKKSSKSGAMLELNKKALELGMSAAESR